MIFETSPIDLGGTSLTKMALEYLLQIGMKTYARELLARDVPPKLMELVPNQKTFTKAGINLASKINL